MDRHVDFVVIHATGTHPFTTAQSIQNYWHKPVAQGGLGWKNPGYNRMVNYRGGVHILAPWKQVTNGVRGFNPVCLHISYIGGTWDNVNDYMDTSGQVDWSQVYWEDTRNKPQKAALLDCIREALEWAMQHQTKVPEILGHHDFPGVTKACPVFPAKEEYAWITA